VHQDEQNNINFIALKNSLYGHATADEYSDLVALQKLKSEPYTLGNFVFTLNPDSLLVKSKVLQGKYEPSWVDTGIVAILVMTVVHTFVVKAMMDAWKRAEETAELVNGSFTQFKST
jgi:hypothetical protein